MSDRFLPRLARILSLALLLPGASLSAAATTAHVDCRSCGEWNHPQEPFRIFGNTWYVGTSALSAVLVTGSRGHVLLDGALPQSAEQIAANIRKLGFAVEDVKLILNSHAHFDHAGGIPALARMSGAQVAASMASAHVLEAGSPGADDPQYDPRHPVRLEPLRNVRIVADGETVTLGELALTAHPTPGHTPGGTTWTWRSCEGVRCHDIVYADSLNPVSFDGFRFSGGPAAPDWSKAFHASIDRVAALPCDIIVSVHPGFSDLFGKLARRRAGAQGGDPFVAVDGCRRYAAAARMSLDMRLRKEAAASR